jgi:hypothetical protein
MWLLLLLLEVAVVVVGEGDSCVKKDQSAAAEKHRRGTVQVNGNGAQSIKAEEQTVQERCAERQ